MMSWKMRTWEESYLLNPSFCALILWSVTKGYKSVSQDGLPFGLAFVAMPLILHKGTRESLPRSTSTSLASWIEKNSYFRVGFAERAKNLVPFTREALLFGLLHGLFALGQTGRIIAAPKLRALPKYLQDATEEVRHCVNRAEFVGKWCAAAGSVETVMALWGIKP